MQNIIKGSLLLGLTLSFLNFSYEPLIKNRPVYDGLKIGKSSYEEVVRKYGPRLAIDTSFRHLKMSSGSDRYITFYEVKYPTRGISFIFFEEDLSSGEIDKIIFSKPGYTTKKGIRIGQSTLGDVLEVYGNGFWSNGNLFYKHKASLDYKYISFRINKSGSGLFLNQKRKQTLMNEIISEIELHPKY